MPAHLKVNSGNIVAPDQYYRTTSGMSGTFNLDENNPFYNEVVDGLVIDSIAVSGSDVTVTFSGSPDLSKVMVGHKIVLQGTTDNVNNTPDSEGFVITAVNDGADTITYTNDRGVVQASAGGVAKTLPFVGGCVLTAVTDLPIDSLEERDVYGNTTMFDSTTLSAGSVLFGQFTEIVLSGAGSGKIQLIG